MAGKIIIKTVKILVLIFIAGFTLAFSFSFGQSLYNTFWELPEEIEVPDIVGEDATVADNKLREKGISLKIVDSKYQGKYPSNTVIEQDPPGGIMVRRGREVLVTISLGPELAEVPDLTGLSQRQATVVLGNNKLKLGKIESVSDSSREPGEILEQNPSSGEKVNIGTEIKVKANKGDEPMVKVPNLVGVSASEADKYLEPRTLQVGTLVWEWHDYVPKGEVIRQIPNPGSLVQPGSQVDLKVSAGLKGLDFNLKQKSMVIFAPKGEGLQTVRLVQVDHLGERTIYNGKHAPGEKIEITVHAWGDSEIQVFYNTRLVRRIRF